MARERTFDQNSTKYLILKWPAICGIAITSPFNGVDGISPIGIHVSFDDNISHRHCDRACDWALDVMEEVIVNVLLSSLTEKEIGALDASDVHMANNWNITKDVSATSMWLWSEEIFVFCSVIRMLETTEMSRLSPLSVTFELVWVVSMGYSNTNRNTTHHPNCSGDTSNCYDSICMFQYYGTFIEVINDTWRW